MKRLPYCILFVLSVLFLFGCSEIKDSAGTESKASESIVSEVSSEEKPITTESSGSVKTTEETSESSISESSVEADNSISGIIRSKCSEWGIETTERSIEGESDVDGYYFSEESNDILEFEYIHFDSKKEAQSAFDTAINDSEVFGYIDEKSENFDREPRKQIMHGYFKLDDNSPEQPDLYVLVQYDHEYFYFYGRGEEQIKRVEDLCSALNIDLT